MIRLLPIALIGTLACNEPPPPRNPPPTAARLAPPDTPPPVAQQPRSTTASGGIVEPRTIHSERDANGEIRETHKRSDGSVAFEATYRSQRPLHLRALAAEGAEIWACDLIQNRPPRCVVRGKSGELLNDEALAARSYDARQRLEAARKLLAPPGHDDDGDHEHSHFDVPAPSKEVEERWQAKRSAAWAESEPWFERVDALAELGFPTVVATTLAKEELSSGFWVVPSKKPIGPDADDLH